MRLCTCGQASISNRAWHGTGGKGDEKHEVHSSFSGKRARRYYCSCHSIDALQSLVFFSALRSSTAVKYGNDNDERDHTINEQLKAAAKDRSGQPSSPFPHFTRSTHLPELGVIPVELFERRDVLVRRRLLPQRPQDLHVQSLRVHPDDGLDDLSVTVHAHNKHHACGVRRGYTAVGGWGTNRCLCACVRARARGRAGVFCYFCAVN